ncbi:hypothetical protein O3P69_007449 [Scylla paramamosain]|uniref:Uncharacterized protein n=1 Tax=Scylla paramamosain TaxID=85552 RepID=A0AAW0V3G8_SCYPA
MLAPRPRKVQVRWSFRPRLQNRMLLLLQYILRRLPSVPCRKLTWLLQIVFLTEDPEKIQSYTFSVNTDKSATSFCLTKMWQH